MPLSPPPALLLLIETAFRLCLRARARFQVVFLYSIGQVYECVFALGRRLARRCRGVGCRVLFFCVAWVGGGGGGAGRTKNSFCKDSKHGLVASMTSRYAA